MKLSLCSTSAVGSISTSTKPCFPAASSRVPPCEAMATLSSKTPMPKRSLSSAQATTSRPEPVAADQVLVDDAAAEEPDPLLDHQPAVAGVRRDPVAQRLVGRAAGDHHPRQRRGGAARRDHRRAVGVGAGDGAQDRALLAAVEQRLDEADLVAAAEQDAAHPSRCVSSSSPSCVGIVEVVDRHPEVDALHPVPGEERDVLGGGAPGLGRGRREHPDRPRRRRGRGRRSPSPARSTAARSRAARSAPRRIRRHPEDAGAPAEALGAAGGAEALALHRAAEVERRHPQAALGRRDQPARAARLALELDGDVDPRARVVGLGPVAVVDARSARTRRAIRS